MSNNIYKNASAVGGETEKRPGMERVYSPEYLLMAFAGRPMKDGEPKYIWVPKRDKDEETA